MKFSDGITVPLDTNVGIKKGRFRFAGPVGGFVTVKSQGGDFLIFPALA